ncbi:hypothetical protein BD779DRAFT_1545318 [Infundibulicybe gibba]|nr:hypothetical protein BD779DRAFT_1545318 [Infundibulicybe gibba]
MKDLPDDIVREIFLACLSGPAYLPPEPHEPRLVLSHVCSPWRAIALSTPELWSEIAIDHSDFPDQDTADDPGYCVRQAWFARSRQCLLSLQIIRVFPSGLRSLFDEYVFPNLHRCRKLKLLVTFTLADQLLHSPGSFQFLESMELEVTGPGARGVMREIMSREPVTSFQVATRLRRVVLVLDELCFDLPRLNLQWQQLSILIIKGPLIPAPCCLEALQECTSLEECELSVTNTHGQAARGASSTPNRPVTLPSLRTMRLGFSVFYNGPSEFLATLHLPGLQCFRLMGGTADLSLAALQPFLAPASPNLEELDISDIRQPFTTELRAFLATLPHLTTLRLPASYPVPEGVLQELATGSISPCLTSVQFGTTNVGRLLAARGSSGSISNITSVLTYYLRPIEGEEHARWVALEEAGIQIGRRRNTFIMSNRYSDG